MKYGKMSRDRMKKFVSDHRVAVSNNTMEFGIAEVRGERKLLLDDVLLEIYECEENQRT